MSILLTNSGGHQYISTSFNASHLRAIPAWKAAEIRRSQLSNGRSSAATSTNGPIDNAGRNIACEERLFITNGACYANERAHLLNAVRGSKTLAKSTVGPLLEEHTRLLMDQTTALVNAIYWKPRGFPTPQPKAKASHTDRDDENDETSGEETATPAPAGRNRSGQGVRTRSSRSKDTPVDEELMSDWS